MSITSAEKRDTIVLGASAAGIEALQRILPAFTVRIDATIVVVQHLPADGYSVLDSVLGCATGYRAAFACDGEVSTSQRVHVAPADCHLLLVGDRTRLWHGPPGSRVGQPGAIRVSAE
jgi:two-component system chemotaxis response regulator CheB